MRQSSCPFIFYFFWGGCIYQWLLQGGAAPKDTSSLEATDVGEWKKMSNFLRDERNILLNNFVW